MAYFVLCGFNLSPGLGWIFRESLGHPGQGAIQFLFTNTSVYNFPLPEVLAQLSYDEGKWGD